MQKVAIIVSFMIGRSAFVFYISGKFLSVLVYFAFLRVVVILVVISKCEVAGSELPTGCCLNDWLNYGVD